MSKNKAIGAHKLIDEVVALIQQKCPKKKAPLLETFVNQYYKNVAEDELMQRDVSDLYGLALSHWSFMEKRKNGAVKLRVFNPSFEKHGWRSAHTVVELSQDDMPFLVDTLIMALNRLKINMHFIIHSSHLRLKRDKTGAIKDVLSYDAPAQEGFITEAPIYIEIDRQEEDPEIFKAIEAELESVLLDVHLAVNDYRSIRERVSEAINDLENAPAHYPEEEVAEAIDFISWIDNNHFTFLGYGEYKKIENQGEVRFKLQAKSCLGLLKNAERFGSGNFLGESARENDPMEDDLLLIAKSDFESTVHRRGRMDVIVVNLYNKQGKIVGERRLLGLFTSIAYHSNPQSIPYIRRKSKLALAHSGFDPNGHSGKALVNVIETFPRDELFQIDDEELFEIAIGILQIQERQQIRLFVIQDRYKRYFSCMVYVPRDLYNTDLRIKMQNILMHELKGFDSTFAPVFFESSILCRIDFLIHADPKKVLKRYDLKQIEAKLVVAARDWRDDLRGALIELKGEHQGSVLFSKYARAFPAGYREAFLPRSAASDIDYIEWVLSQGGMGMCFYRLLEEPEDCIRFKLFQKDNPIPLTEVLPILENMGLSVIEERPYEVKLDQKTSIWISDFGMRVLDSLVDPDEISHTFQEAFASVWSGQSENDGFNRLVMRAGLAWRQIIVLRCYAKYLMQIGFRYSQSYIEDTLSENPQVANQLIALFATRFDPAIDGREKKAAGIVNEIANLLESVTNLDRDRILRRFMDVILATLRTNYFQLNAEGVSKAYLSIKLKPNMIPDMPKPLPVYEIYVYSPCVEGVHLRGAKVARGGLRWSDRREDYRREVLGLMKAQQVKNSVIVPLGAKGGFIVKCLPDSSDRDALMQEGIRCYKTFIRGLLDLTDNRQGDDIVPPRDVVRYDEDDPYLVVAADKGTATFSDIANGVAEEYGFWLGDAFASGGSNGYDHKKMGITAKGAWESVKRHFLGLGKDIQNEDFTVVGIGDMSGDVFGNGMLLSKHIRLIAAFNHQHIFIDPNPDSATSFKERSRLFALGRSSWTDYNTDLISKGGGVFSRDAKSIPLSSEAQKALKIKAKSLEPTELIQAILKSKVELLWNGGIGTYVKAVSENNLDVGDRSNDALRVNGEDLRCRVVGEGGNLGFTQLARVEYAHNGGLNYTDSTDNSAGVDCSDHEVNIKILLNDAMARGELTDRQRNNLLAKMADEVSALVLTNNYHQTQAIDNMVTSSPDVLYLQLRLIRELEREGFMDRALEFIPSDKEMKTRFANNIGLMRPEMSILMAYCKTAIKGELLKSALPEEPYFERYLEMEFPVELRKRFYQSMKSHFLGREIICTHLTNEMIQRMGMAYVHRLYDETGATPASITRAYVVASQIFDMPKIWAQIESLDGTVPAISQQELMRDVTRLIRRASRWILRNHRSSIDVQSMIDNLKPSIQKLRVLSSKLLTKEERNAKKDFIKRAVHAGVKNDIALKCSDYPFMSPFMDIIEATKEMDGSIQEMAEVYYKLNERLSFSWFRSVISTMRGEGYWGMLASSGLRDDLDNIQRNIAFCIVKTTSSKKDVADRVEEWANHYRFMVNRWHYMVNALKTTNQDFIMYQVALRGLFDLSQACLYGGESYRDQDVSL